MTVVVATPVVVVICKVKTRRKVDLSANQPEQRGRVMG